MTDQIKKDNMQPKKEKSVFKTRLLSSIVLIVILFLFIASSIIYTEGSRAGISGTWVASYITLILTSSLTGIAIFEGARALGIKKWYSFVGLIILGILTYLFPIINEDQKVFTYELLNKINIFEWYKWYIGLAFIFVTIIFIILAMRESTINSFKATVLMILIFFIITFGLKGFTNLSLMIDNNGKPYYSFTTIIWVWMIIILTDSFAYIGGSKFGKTKMAPEISPKKTWEGAIIGFGAAIIIGTIFASLLFRFASDYSPMSFNMTHIGINKGTFMVYLMYLLIGILISFIGVIGDLLFSYVKRFVSIKDYSNLIPGHGGVLDRLDSFLLVFFALFFVTLI